MRTVQCPYCHKTLDWSEQYPYRPFCSERCRTIDLGAWASERYAIPSQGTDNTDQDDEQLEN